MSEAEAEEIAARHTAWMSAAERECGRRREAKRRAIVTAHVGG